MHVCCIFIIMLIHSSFGNWFILYYYGATRGPPGVSILLRSVVGLLESVELAPFHIVIGKKPAGNVVATSPRHVQIALERAKCWEWSATARSAIQVMWICLRRVDAACRPSRTILRCISSHRTGPKPERCISTLCTVQPQPPRRDGLWQAGLVSLRGCIAVYPRRCVLRAGRKNFKAFCRWGINYTFLMSVALLPHQHQQQQLQQQWHICMHLPARGQQES